MKLKVGIVGLSHPHAPGHLRTLELMDDVEAIYLVEEDPAILERFKDRQKVAGAFTELDDLLRRDDVPVLEVLKRNDEAVPVMMRVIEAGKHVISDKPAARTADELAPLLDAAAKKNLVVSVHYTNRWNPEYEQVRHLRQSGALGRLVSAEFRVITTSVRSRNPRHWLFSKKLAGGGILHWLGCHQIDMLRYVSGEEVTAVSAICRTLSGEDIDVEDVATVSLSLSGGALATIHAGYMIQGGSKGDILPSYDVPFGLRGTLGRIWLESGPGDTKLTLQSVAPGWDHAGHHTFSYTMHGSEAYGGRYGIDFVRAIFRAALEGGKPPVTGEDALKVLQIVEAAYKSSETGRTVTL